MRLPVFSMVMVALLAAAGCSDDETKTSYIVCESTYALCTTARCAPMEEGEETVFCDCAVETGYSVGSTPCHDPIDSPEGRQILSRYYPIKSYATCSNDRPWAWCFDRPCVVDKANPTKAVCACNIVRDEGPYVMVTDSYSESTCTTGLYSSARVTDFKHTTDFLKSSKELKPFPLKKVGG